MTTKSRTADSQAEKAAFAIRSKAQGGGFMFRMVRRGLSIVCDATCTATSDLPADGLTANPQQRLRHCVSLCLLGTAWPLFALVTLYSSTVRSWTGWNSFELAYGSAV